MSRGSFQVSRHWVNHKKQILIHIFEKTGRGLKSKLRIGRIFQHFPGVPLDKTMFLSGLIKIRSKLN